MKKYPLLLTVLLFVSVSCQKEEPVPVQEHDVPQSFMILDASLKAQEILSSFKSNNRRLETPDETYEPGNLKVLLDVEDSLALFSVLNSENSSEALSFRVDEAGEIDFVFKSRATVHDSFVSVELMSVEGEVMLAYNDHFNGTREIVFEPTHTANARSWWKRTGHCIGVFNGPFDDEIANEVYGIIVNASTVGLYTGMSAIMCAGFAAAGGDIMDDRYVSQ